MCGLTCHAPGPFLSKHRSIPDRRNSVPSPSSSPGANRLPPVAPEHIMAAQSREAAGQAVAGHYGAALRASSSVRRILRTLSLQAERPSGMPSDSRRDHAFASNPPGTSLPPSDHSGVGARQATGWRPSKPAVATDVRVCRIRPAHPQGRSGRLLTCPCDVRRSDAELPFAERPASPRCLGSAQQPMPPVEVKTTNPPRRKSYFEPRYRFDHVRRRTRPAASPIALPAILHAASTTRGVRPGIQYWASSKPTAPMISRAADQGAPLRP